MKKNKNPILNSILLHFVQLFASCPSKKEKNIGKECREGNNDCIK